MNTRHLTLLAALTLAACSSKTNGSSSSAGSTGGAASGSSSGTTGGGTSGTSSGGTSSGGTSSGGTSSGGTSGGGTSSGGASSSGGSSGNPAPPALGAQIDRMGRPAVNTALTDPFDTVAATLPDGGHKTPEVVKDEYNFASDPATWSANYRSPIAVNLAILDGLDRNCGNQLLAADGGATVPAGRYTALATVLVDDRLYLNTASGTCTTYLGVEANAVGIPNTDCGGRTPLEDVVDVSYSVLAAGALSGVTDGVDRDSDGTASLTDFPFLAAPNP